MILVCDPFPGFSHVMIDFGAKAWRLDGWTGSIHVWTWSFRQQYWYKVNRMSRPGSMKSRDDVLVHMRG